MKKALTHNILIQDIQLLIDGARHKAAQAVNTTHLLLNWHIGDRIQQEFLKDQARTELYGQQIIHSLAEELEVTYGRSYDRSSLSRMIKFAKLFPDKENVATLAQQLRWSHVIEVLAIQDDLKRDFYIEMCRIERWSVRGLRKKINSLLFERTALAKKPDILIKKELERMRDDGTLSTDVVFHDPYIIPFTGLKDNHSETDLENAILDELVPFLQELGSDFCFVARQKRMSTETTDKFLDLLLFHRSLKKLIALELKIGRFEPAHKGQMEWYLNWLDQHERKPDEGKPIGIILCADKNEDDIHYLDMDTSGIHVAQYLTALPPKKILEEKLRQAIRVARERYESLQLLEESKKQIDKLDKEDEA
jgi:predicted nuclease of restriction endonuclease-like (RecB) superfamily